MEKMSKLNIFNFPPILSCTHHQTKCGLTEVTKIGGEMGQEKFSIDFEWTLNGLLEPTPAVESDVHHTHIFRTVRPC